MSKQEEKKMNFEFCIFKAQWNTDYIVIELDGKALCLLCNDTIVVLKEYK